MENSSNPQAFRVGQAVISSKSLNKSSKEHFASKKNSISLGKAAIAHLKRFALDKSDELKYYEPKTWFFWRGVILYFCFFSIVGHWMEIPYCHSMSALFGIVEETYDVWTDPLYVPYWVYGIGATAITLLLMPLKFWIVKRGKSMLKAALIFLVAAIALAAFLECVIGLLINQPDQFGEYPFWNNSVLPLNILGQAWLVNDFFLGLVSLAYVWILFPFCQKFMKNIGEKAANRVFVCGMVLFGFLCILSYA